MRFSIFSTILASLAVLDGTLAARVHVLNKGAKAHWHAGREVAKRGEHQLAKRFSNTRFSFFDTGLGACGGYNKASDFIVAINTHQWDGGSHCGETITITYGGKTAQATIADQCMECPDGALDFTRGLFDHFGSQSQGYLYGSWTFGSGDPKPKPTPKPSPSPTTSWKTTTTSTSTKHMTTKTLTTSIQISTTSTSTSTSISVVPTPTASGVLVDSNQILLAFAGIAIGGVAGNA